MIARNGQAKIVVAGLGNVLMSDDGVGVHAVRRLQEERLEGVIIAEVGTAALHWQEMFEAADIVIAVDAVEAGGRSGEVYVFELADAEGSRLGSVHDLGMAGVLRLIAESERPGVVVVGVEPERIGYGMELSAKVEGSLTTVLRTVRQLIASKGSIGCMESGK